MTTAEDILRLRKKLDELHRKHQPTGVLIASEDENGVVHVTREKDGSLYAMMPRDVWDQLVDSLPSSVEKEGT
jgi:hypothetical protein